MCVAAHNKLELDAMQKIPDLDDSREERDSVGFFHRMHDTMRERYPNVDPRLIYVLPVAFVFVFFLMIIFR